MDELERAELLLEQAESGPLPRSDKKPAYKRDYADMVEIFLGEYAISKSTDKKPVLATDHLATCVGVVGWSPKERVGFLAHYDHITAITDSIYVLCHDLSKEVTLPTEFEVRLAQGCNMDKGKLVDLIKERLKESKDITMKLLEEDLEGETADFKQKSIALDTRTGEVYSYNSDENPEARTMDLLDEVIQHNRRMMGYTPAMLRYPTKKEPLRVEQPERILILLPHEVRVEDCSPRRLLLP